MKSPLSLVMQAEAPSSSISVRESESNCLPGGVLDMLFSHVVVMTGMVSWSKRSHGTFLCLRRRGPAPRGPCDQYLRCTLIFDILLKKRSAHRHIAFSIDLIHIFLGGLNLFGT